MRGECIIREAKLEFYKGEENAFRGKGAEVHRYAD